jgi:hypothetical protein
MSNDGLAEDVELPEIQPKMIVSKLPFDNKKCPLIVSEQGNATALYRYSNAGPLIDLSDPFSSNLLPAIKFSIIQGKLCIFNFGSITKIDQIPAMIDRLKEKCSAIHKDLYNHLINNSLMKQSFDSIMALIPFDPTHELVPEIYENSQQTVRILFFIESEDLSLIKNHQTDPNLSLFKCIYIKP